MANFSQNMIWNQNIFPDGLICIFPGLFLLEHLGGMMFVHRIWEMLNPGRGWVFLNRISWLVQVDQEELCRLRKALEMGQNRAMHKTPMICGSEETDTDAQICSTLLPSLSRKDTFMTKMCWHITFPPSYCFRWASEAPKPSSDMYLYPPKSVLVLHIQKAASPCPVWSRRCNKTRKPQETQG